MLDQRLKNESTQTGVALLRLRKAVACERFLARLVVAAPNRWVLKGAFALDLRLGICTRITKDIDVGRSDIDEEMVMEDFITAQAVDLVDHFFFEVQRTPALDKAADFRAVRYRVSAELAGRRFEQFPVDVALAETLPDKPDWLRGTDLLT